MADPGFPIGGAGPLGVLTSDAGAFWEKHMQKQYNWILLRERVPAAPLDLPMIWASLAILSFSSDKVSNEERH